MIRMPPGRRSSGRGLGRPGRAPEAHAQPPARENCQSRNSGGKQECGPSRSERMQELLHICIYINLNRRHSPATRTRVDGLCHLSAENRRSHTIISPQLVVSTLLPDGAKATELTESANQRSRVPHALALTRTHGQGCSAG